MCGLSCCLVTVLGVGVLVCVCLCNVLYVCVLCNCGKEAVLLYLKTDISGISFNNL